MLAAGHQLKRAECFAYRSTKDKEPRECTIVMCNRIFKDGLVLQRGSLLFRTASRIEGCGEAASASHAAGIFGCNTPANVGVAGKCVPGHCCQNGLTSKYGPDFLLCIRDAIPILAAPVRSDYGRLCEKQVEKNALSISHFAALECYSTSIARSHPGSWAQEQLKVLIASISCALELSGICVVLQITCMASELERMDLSSHPGHGVALRRSALSFSAVPKSR